MAKKATTAGKTAKKNETKVMVTCPKCGEQIEVEIPNKEQFMSGMAIGKDSGLGTIFLPTVSPAQKKRMEELEKSGVVFEQTIKVKTADGKTVEIKQTSDGGIDFEDPVIKAIINGGNLYDPHIAKQHVTAMMLKMLTRKWYRSGSSVEYDRFGNYDLSHFQKNMVNSGYEYTWKVLLEKLNEQIHMEKNGDVDALKEDSRWYNKTLAVKMFDDYMAQLKALISSARVRMCKRRPYIKYHYAYKLGYGYAGVFLSELPSLYETLEAYGYDIKHAKNISALHDAVEAFVEKMPRLQIAPGETARDQNRFEVHQCPEWQDAYKGYGAFFTMKNLILYHDCRVMVSENHKSRMLSETDSIAQLNEWANLHEGYWLLGALKQFLQYNRFDIVAKQKSWYEAKRNKR